MDTYTVSVANVKDDTGNELSDTFYHNCMFCEKLVRVVSSNFKSCLNLGGGKFYCPFCLRNNFHHRTSKNVLIFSYKGVIGQYYYRNYRNTRRQNKRLFLAQIKEMIDDHEEVGLKFPALSYDPATYLWFADFNKIGNDPRKAPIEDLQSHMMMMMMAFKIDEIYAHYFYKSLWKKFDKAITIFYKKRQRPKDMRMLIPTFRKIEHGEKDSFFDVTRNFSPAHLELK